MSRPWWLTVSERAEQKVYGPRALQAFLNNMAVFLQLSAFLYVS